MIFLEFKPFNAPHQYKFKDPDTGHRYDAKDFPSLYKLIINYRAQNALPELEYLPQIVSHYLCSLPENVGRCTPITTMKRSSWGYLKGGMQLLKNLAFKNYVDQSEADRRSLICKGCKFNVFPNRTTFVKWSDQIADASIGQRRSVAHKFLGNCEVCTCTLKPKVWCGDPITLDNDEVKRLPDFCWQLPLVTK